LFTLDTWLYVCLRIFILEGKMWLVIYNCLLIRYVAFVS
jgi:hypothetical protein